MSESDTSVGVPPPRPPDAPDAWYAPDVLRQEEIHPGVVVTVRRAGDEFRYTTREPSLSTNAERALGRVREYFSAASATPPLTREGAVERMAAGVGPKYERAVDRLTDLSAAMEARLTYHVLAEVRCLGSLTPHALDDAIEVADERDGEVIVHTADYAPVRTGIAETDHLERFASERLSRYSVSFLDFEIPVVVYRENVLGNDPFTTKYAIREPDLLPGDRALVEECKERIWEATVDGVFLRDDGTADDDATAFVRERAEAVLSRRLTAEDARTWLEALRYRLRTALAAYDLALPPVDERFAPDRLSDLVYYVLRDYVGYGHLTIPIRDGRLEDIEANRVGERVKVVPRGLDERVPTNLAFEREAEFVNVVTQLAASDGVEVNASTPSAKVNLRPPGSDETIRCAVALPTISEGGPHISIRKQAPEPLTPVDLVEAGSLPTELVALLWLLYEHHGVVLFAGPTGVGKTTLMNAHVPFIPFDDRPVSIDEGSREVWLPHETGVSLTTRDHEREYKRVTMADLMTETNYLNPDVEIIAEINTPESFASFAQIVSTGHGVLGTTHAEDVERLVNRAVEQGLPAYLLAELDLVVFPKRVGGERYVGRVVEFLDGPATGSGGGVVERGGTTIHYDTVCERTVDGGFAFAYDHPALGDDARDCRTAVFDRIADRTDRPVEAVEREFLRKHRYVEYLVNEGVSDADELFGFLADLRANEAATVERVAHARRRERGEDGGGEIDEGRVRDDGTDGEGVDARLDGGRVDGGGTEDDGGNGVGGGRDGHA
ncbi:type II/IV secretion system ATPase subunit [Halomarina pelagica]|uniref:type II/IV secretion system ATPase subunit n=1 Tax=Halomarina pelagica TaxID=2961599 RepID=UPI0020C2EFEA|nr:type II/IV secretion system ATPase subunit [Halomarina sp. BND7]